MTTFRDKLNAHLPIVLQFVSTASLVVLALSAICGSKSLKKLSEGHELHAFSSSHTNYIDIVKVNRL